jgi:pimeloyl-ACP methyl ester carboxylesterase
MIEKVIPQSTSARATELTVGEGAEARKIAVSRRDGGGPGLFWLSGFRSSMAGLKASRLDEIGADNGLRVTRFDYSGHGESGGAFLDGTISRWLEEALAVFATTKGPQILVGSSMGGWIALLLARALRAAEQHRLAGIVLIAPGVDMTNVLVTERFSAAQLAELARDGRVTRPSAYGDGPYVYTRALLEDGNSHHLLLEAGSVRTGCPVHILQGAKDPDVPPERAERLMRHFTLDPATLTLIPDGDHRLSRPEDLALLERVVMGLVANAGLHFHSNRR